MKNVAKNVSISAALKRWRQKHPSLVKVTVLAWISEGLVKCHKEKHGFTEWHTFTKEEVERVYKLLKTDWQQGQQVLPRPNKPA